MLVTKDDKYVITCGNDGVLMIHEIKDKEAKGTRIR